MRMLVIANPVAGPQRGRLSGEQAGELLEAQGAEVKVEITDAPGHATELAQGAVGWADLVVAVGGDGTVMETASGLVGTQVPLAVLPSGSGNDFATANGVGTVAEGIASIFAGKVWELDVGALDGAFFFNSVGLLGSGLVSQTASRLRRWLGRRRYVLAGAYHVLAFKGQRLQWLAPGSDEAVIDDVFMMVEVCNGPLTGGGFRFAPDAVFDDGLLDICLFRKVGAFTGLRMLPRAAGGQAINHTAASVLRAGDMRFVSDQPVAFHRDGEPGILPAGMHRIHILAEKLRFCRPA